MIGTLARKRTNLAAFAVLAALAVALFAVVHSISAVDGSIKVEIGEDGTIAGIPEGYDAAASTDEAIATVSATPSAVSPATTPPTQEVTVTGVAAGTTTITVTDDAATDTLPALVYEVEVVPFGIAKIEFVDESDAIVKAGTRVTVRVTLQSQDTNSEVNLTIPTTGLSIVSGTGTTQSLTQDTDNTTKQAEWTLNTAGAPEGEYTLTFVADHDDTDDADPTKDVTGTAVLTIGEPGEGLASASLGPAPVKGGVPSTAGDAAPDKTTKKAGSTIYLAVSASNSLGARSNPGDVDQVIVFAVGATISDAANANPESNSKTFAEISTDSPDVDNVGATQVFAVTSAKPATITVRATVIGPSGSQNADSIDVVFTGNAEAITLGDASDQLAQQNDSITVELTATDNAGNPATINTLQTTSVKVLDSDGNTAKNISASEAQKVDNKGTEDDTSDDEDVPTALVITISSSSSAKAEPGSYTLEVKLGTKSTATADFTVVGAAANVDLSADATESDTIGDVITVTATVTDADGNAVADGTAVEFGVSANTGLAAIGTGHGEGDKGRTTKGGTASVKYAVVGAGTSVISATATVSGASGVVVITSTAGVTEAVEEVEEASLDCLSSLSGFSTWTCGVDSTASEVFAMISGRGATALQLWNGSAWVRYSVRDGNEIPGSTDFMVTEDDILYISN